MNQESISRELKRQLPLELARRLEDKSPQFGKTVFMKLAYLLQELYDVPLGYRFSLYTYGPYSPEVLGDLEYAKLRRQVNVEYLEDGPGGFRITSSERVGSSGEQDGRISDFGDALNNLIEHFGTFTARELELRTTSIFLWKRMTYPTVTEDFNKLVETVHQLKPHFEKTEIRFVIKSLVEDDIIRFF